MTNLERWLYLNCKAVNKKNIFNIIYKNSYLLCYNNFDYNNNILICSWINLPENYNMYFIPIKLLAINKVEADLLIKLLTNKFKLKQGELSINQTKQEQELIKLIKIPCKINDIIFDGYINMNGFYYIIKNTNEEYQAKLLNFLKNNSLNKEFLNFKGL